jgi:hypothetical protein
MERSMDASEYRWATGKLKENFAIGVSEETEPNAAIPPKTRAPGTRSLRDGVERMAAPRQSHHIAVIAKMLKGES